MAKDWILQITRQSLALSVLLIASLPAFGQYESAEEFYIPKGCEIVTLTTPISTDIQWADGYYFFASGKGIFACDHQKNLTLLIEAKSDINAFCLGENVLFFHTGSSLARYSFESKTTETISRKIKGKVTMASLGGALYFSFNQDIFLYEDGEMYRLVRESSDIVSLAVHKNNSIFYSTTKGIYYLDGHFQRVEIYDKPASELSIIDGNLYIALKNGSCFVLTNAFLFKDALSAQGITGKESAFELLAGNHIPEAISAYAVLVKEAQENRKAGKGVSGDLLAEYAYALALSHDYEAALMYIDRGRALKGKYQDYLAGQILRVMGYDAAAGPLEEGVNPPERLSRICPTLTAIHRLSLHPSDGLYKEDLVRTQQLASQGQSIQALALLEGMRIANGDKSTLLVAESVVWENLGKKPYAVELLQRAVTIKSSDGGRRQEQSAVYRQHLDLLEQTPAPKRFSPGLMVYGGAAYAAGLFSLNGRVGLYTKNQFSVAINLGTSFGNNQVVGNLGLSGYKNWKIFLFGLGINDQFSKGSNVFSLSPTFGISIPNDTQTASWDIIANLYLPIGSGSGITYSLSFGRTVYLDFKRAKK